MQETCLDRILGACFSLNNHPKKLKMMVLGRVKEIN
jgi:hypothetical protein